jgi:SPP1 family predicted phage head-tail adaptor
MNIAGMNIRITFQKNGITVDAIGNHIAGWTDFYTCWATPVQSGGDENEDAGTTNSVNSQDFTIRYCKKLAELDSTKLRIILNGDIYNITSIDQMGYHKRSLKFHCEKVKR